MISIGIFVLILSSLLFLTNIAFLLVIFKEFSSMRASYIIMKSSFTDNLEMMEGMQTFVQQSLGGSEQICNNVMEKYSEIMQSNNHLQERINEIEASLTKPMAPDITLN